jgi:hypothetical protein
MARNRTRKLAAARQRASQAQTSFLNSMPERAGASIDAAFPSLEDQLSHHEEHPEAMPQLVDCEQEHGASSRRNSEAMPQLVDCEQEHEDCSSSWRNSEAMPQLVDCESDSGETTADEARRSEPELEVPAETDDDVLQCLFCYDELGDDNPTVDTTEWDTQVHTIASPGCGIFERSCAKCLLGFVNSHEREPEREGSYPCPLCRAGLREPTLENLSRCTCTKTSRASAQFQLDCQSLLDDLRQPVVMIDKAFASRRRSRLKEHYSDRKKSLEDIPAEYKLTEWYKDAFLNFQQDQRLYKKVRARYYEHWPPAAAGAQPAGGYQPRWEEYDPRLWEAATAADGPGMSLGGDEY